MRRDAGHLTLSATDLANFLNCRHRTALEMGEARGVHRRPRWTDPLLEALFARGLEHERTYVSGLIAEGRKVVDLSDIKAREQAVGATRDAVRAGADVIVQAALEGGRFYGRPDVLLRVEQSSALGNWSYETADTKLAIETRSGTIVQLGLYCDLVDAFQSRTPEYFHVVTPDVEAPIKGPSMAEVHPTSVIEHRHVNATVIEDSIFAIGEAVEQGQEDRLAFRLLKAEPPSTHSGAFAMAHGESAVQFAVRVAADFNETVLAIQGPPGTGKTFTGAQMICALVGQGKRVGVVATGHSVIRNLLDAVATAAAKGGRDDIRLGHKVDESSDDGAVRELGKNEEAFDALTAGEVNVLGGTAWLWARLEFTKSVDVLFVDEAGQMSLANVLAVTQAARSIVLLGDPQQLEQPEKGTHPEGVGVSALQHMLGDHITIPSERGIFLPETWRLAPSISAFTSEVFYEGRLRSKEGLERQQLIGSRFAGSSLWAIDVEHEGNRNASDEEVSAIERLATTLLAPGSRWMDERGVAAQLRGEDVLVVAPFNAQVNRLADRLSAQGVRVGTVDKFQGQEAPVVIYSMACSSPDDAPRGLEFLYSLNRLNVATSRA